MDIDAMLRQCVKIYIMTRRYGIWITILTAMALLMTQLPLINDLGFEFSAGISLLAGYAAGCLSAVHFARLPKLTTPTDSIGYELVPVGLGHILLLLPPFIIISIKSILSGLCNYPEGLAFFFLIPVITTLFTTALGAVCGLLTSQPRKAYLLFIGYTLLTFGIGIYRLITQPPVFAYHDLIGYFPGPIYDEVVRITSTLLIARGVVLLKIFAIVTGLVICIAPDTGRIDLRRLIRPLAWPHAAGFRLIRITFFVALMGLMAAYAYRAPLGMVIDRAYIQETLGGYKQTEHFDIYYDINASTAKQIDLMALDHEFQYARLSTFLEVDPSQRVASYIYASPDQKKRLMGARYTSIERPGEDEMHLNDRAFPHPVMKHELAHVLSSSFGNWLYGGSYKMGFHEGLAVAADWSADQLTVHQWSRAMRQLNLAPPLERILGTVGFWSEAPSRSYTLCGSFIRFLIDRYGMDRFKLAFPNGEVEMAYQQPLSQLISTWEAFVDSTSLTEEDLRIAQQRFRRSSIFERRCAHEVASLMDYGFQQYQRGRYQEAIHTFDRVRSFEPENPSALRGLLRAAYQAGDYQRTATIADSILLRPDRGVSLIAETYMVQGDLAWIQRDSTKASALYQQVLELHASASSDRSARIKLAALVRPAIADKVLTYLISNQNNAEYLVLVKEAIEAEPDFAAGFYLIGRRLFNAEAYRRALPYLAKADRLTLPDVSLGLENKRLMAMSYFYLGAYDQAIDVFQQLMTSSSSEAMKTRSESWILRCEWLMKQQGAEEGDL